MPQVISDLERRAQTGVSLFWRIAAAGLGVVLVLYLIMAGWQAYHHSKVTAQAQQLEQQKNYPAEEILLTNYVKSNPPKHYQYPALLHLADLEFNDRNYALASEWYFKAYLIDHPAKLPEVLGLAKTAAQLGDTATAIQYYRQSITLLPQTPQNTYSTRVGQYQDDITTLGGKP